MGIIRDWLEAGGETWHRMPAGDPSAFSGTTGSATGTATGGTGTGGMPSSLTDDQRRQLNIFFHRQYGRSPQTEYEFQQWLRANW